MERPYYVVSPEYQTFAGSYEPPEPPEYGRDVVCVEAATKRAAVALGVKALLSSRRRSWPRDQRVDGVSPFTGMRAELAVCGHGNPHFVLVNGHEVAVRCWACDELREVGE